jgi:hypothetical protein
VSKASRKTRVFCNSRYSCAAAVIVGTNKSLPELIPACDVAIIFSNSCCSAWIVASCIRMGVLSFWDEKNELMNEIDNIPRSNNIALVFQPFFLLNNISTNLSNRIPTNAPIIVSVALGINWGKLGIKISL